MIMDVIIIMFTRPLSHYNYSVLLGHKKRFFYLQLQKLCYVVMEKEWRDLLSLTIEVLACGEPRQLTVGPLEDRILIKVRG
jgi:hypothetical protein